MPRSRKKSARSSRKGQSGGGFFGKGMGRGASTGFLGAIKRSAVQAIQQPGFAQQLTSAVMQPGGPLQQITQQLPNVMGQMGQMGQNRGHVMGPSQYPVTPPQSQLYPVMGPQPQQGMYSTGVQAPQPNPYQHMASASPAHLMAITPQLLGNQGAILGDPNQRTLGCPLCPQQYAPPPYAQPPYAPQPYAPQPYAPQPYAQPPYTQPQYGGAATKGGKRSRKTKKTSKRSKRSKGSKSNARRISRGKVRV